MPTTYALLCRTLTTLFETKTIRVGAFEGRGRRRLEIPADYFSGDRLRRAHDKPVNVLCGRRVMELAGRVLDGRSDYDPCAFSRAVRNLVYDLYGVETGDFVIDGEDDPDRKEKVKAQKALLRRLLTDAVGEAIVDDEAGAAALRQVAADQRGKLGWKAPAPVRGGYAYGVERFEFRSGDVGYDGLIAGAERHIDVLHFCGQTWTNTHAEFLRDALARPGVEMRVGLLDPASLFFSPFAEYVGNDPATLAGKTADVVAMWQDHARRAAKAAARRGCEPAHLTLYLTRDFPAKALYRFDERIVVCPKVNTRAKGQFMTYTCADDGHEKCAFRVLADEMDVVFSSARLAWDSYRPADFPALDAELRAPLRRR